MDIEPKYALCLVGQPRFVEEGYKFWNKYLFEPNGGQENFNIFCHAWWNPENVGKPWDGPEWLSGGKAGFVRADTPETIKTLYKPSDYQFDPQKDFSNHRDYSSYCTKTPPAMLFSYYFSMNQSILMMHNYASRNNIWYDNVVCGRYDCVPTAPIILKDHREHPHSYRMPDDIWPNKDNLEQCSTAIIFSSHFSMIKLPAIYYSMDHWWTCNGIRFGGECITGYALHKYGDKKPITMPYAFIRQWADNHNEIAASNMEKFL